MSDWKAKRFWKEVSVTEAETGFGVALDGRTVKTPAKTTLVVPSRAMAEAIAAEWDAQDGQINPTSMPVTQTANSAIDKVSIQHAEVAEMLAAYGDSDLLCYRADSPETLVARQSAIWDPLLDWAAHALEARLETRTGVMHARQQPEVLKVLSDRTHAFNNFELAAFHDLVGLSGSLVIGFAATQDAWDAETLWETSQLDEIWQVEQWGADDLAESQTALKRAAFLHAKRMFDFCSA